MESSLAQLARYLAAQSWQIAVLTALIASAMLFLKNGSAHVCYLLWLIVLAKCLTPPLFSVPLAVLPETRSAMVAAEPMVHDAADTSAAEVSPLAPDDPMTTAPASAAYPQTSTERVQTPATSRRFDAVAWAGALWLTGACTCLLRDLLRAMRGTLWLRRRRKPLPVKLSQAVEKQLCTCGAECPTTIWLVDDGNQPFVWGLVRGSIYLPVDFLRRGNLRQQRIALVHEINHVLRLDAAINTLQVLAQGIFWFHPLVWWVNHRIRVEREKCCDEAAIAILRASPRDYGTAIVETISTKHRSLRPVPSLAVAGSARDIEERIKAMMTPGRKFHRQLSPTSAVTVALLAILTVPTTIVFTTRAQAQTSTAGRTAQTAPAPGTSSTSVQRSQPVPKAPAGKARVSANKAERVLHFPTGRPVGKIYVQGEGGTRKLTYWFHWTAIEDPPSEYFCEAQGDIRIPAGKHARLTVNADSWGDLSWLTKLQPDDLYSLGFVVVSNRVGAGDARLKPVTHLTGLKQLSLEGTDITDWGMSMLASFPSLEELDLNARVTDRGMVHVAQLKSLKRLYFPMQTKVSSAGLQHISKLTALEELYLGQGIGDAGLAYLRGLPHLTYLCLYGPGFTDAGMVYVKEVPSLRIFSVHENLSRITDAGLVHIAELPNLELLCVGGMRGITDAGIAHLTKMRSLRKLDIGSSRVTDKGLGYLKQIKTLEHLDLPQDQYNISDAGLAHLAELSNLKVLHVSRLHYGGRDRNRIYYTDAGLAQLSKLRSLEELVVGSIGVTDAGMDHIAKLTNLKKLFMFGCEKVTDKGLARLTTLKSLKDLDIAHAKLTIAGLAVLNSMTSLTRLDAGDLERGGAVLNLSGLTNLEDLSLGFGPRSQDAFNDADLACLANLKKLRWLQIGPRNFTDQGMLYLAGLTNIDRLGLGGAGLTDEGLKRLANLKKLDLLTILGKFDSNIGNWTSGGHITDKGLGYLENFKQLSFVEIYSDSSFSDEAVQRLYEQLPNLFHLNLNGSNCRPSGIGVR